MKLVANWKSFWKWNSVQAMTAATALQGTWMSLPPDLKSKITPDTVHVITMAILVLGVIGRLRDQGSAK